MECGWCRRGYPMTGSVSGAGRAGETHGTRRETGKRRQTRQTRTSTLAERELVWPSNITRPHCLPSTYWVLQLQCDADHRGLRPTSSEAVHPCTLYLVQSTVVGHVRVVLARLERRPSCRVFSLTRQRCWPGQAWFITAACPALLLSRLPLVPPTTLILTPHQISIARLFDGFFVLSNEPAQFPFFFSCRLSSGCSSPQALVLVCLLGSCSSTLAHERGAAAEDLFACRPSHHDVTQRTFSLTILSCAHSPSPPLATTKCPSIRLSTRTFSVKVSLNLSPTATRNRSSPLLILMF